MGSKADECQSAVIAEGLRLAFGITTRLPRIATGEVLRYKDWEIPFGVGGFCDLSLV